MSLSGISFPIGTRGDDTLSSHAITCLAQAGTMRTFGFWQRLGFHVTPVDYYRPIPNKGELTIVDVSGRSAAIGVEFNSDSQLRMLARFTHNGFLLSHYPPDWIERLWQFWIEQYLLQALLAFNRNSRVTWAETTCTSNIPLRSALASKVGTRSDNRPGASG